MPRERKPAKKGEIEPNEQEPCEPRSYYYDDAHGYEDFDPQEEAEDDEVMEKPTS
ncbi:MAG: hypothetical protein IPM50_13115 [Acidobacteriota bacterium]|nr:MAG: hypothetical protein IPM50_13115 [Acidobacteriota bacterium]